MESGTELPEPFVAGLFARRFGLDLQKIPERATPTPDFTVYCGGRELAVLELKTIEATAPIFTPDTIPAVLSPADPATYLLPGTLRNDNCVSRVAAKIHSAAKQLRTSTLPRILTLLNDYSEADSFDMLEAVQGYLRYGDEKITSIGPDTASRLAEDLSVIDLLLWVERDLGEHPRLISTSAVGRELRLRYFGSPITRVAV
jgi:hypothetical protein